MAKARETPAPDPPVASDEESSSEEENQGSESESEPENPLKSTKSSSVPAPGVKKTDAQTTKSQASAPAPSSSSSEDEESGSETDNESPPKKADPSIKPIASKPMNGPEKATPTTKKPRSKANASGPTSPTRPTTSAGAKRPAPVAETPAGDAGEKKSKRKLAEASEKKGTPNNDEGKKLFVRLWSEDDEIVILKGLIEYPLKKKTDPFTDMNGFHEFIKNKISIEMTRVQLQDKIRRMKKKYTNIAEKERKGKERIFSNPHDQTVYELSKKVWGSKKNAGEETAEVPKANGTAVKKSRSKGSVGTTPKIDGAEEEEEDLGNERDECVSFVPDEWYFSEGMKLMPEEHRVDMEKKWKQFRVEESGLLVKKYELLLEHMKKIHDGLKPQEK